MKKPYALSVFINCPFDNNYKPLFQAIVFTVYRCGFSPQCALQEDDSSDNRIDKIIRIINGCRYGIHDISRTQLDADTQLPRFNMPFELGLFWGAKKFGLGRNSRKISLILECRKYDYQKYISDINGVDTKAHDNSVQKVVQHVRNWLSTVSKRKNIPSPAVILKDYHQLNENQIPDMLEKGSVLWEDVTFNEYCLYIEEALLAKLNQ
jgi:hypothetical protein